MPEGVLFQNSNAFVSVKKDLVDDFNLECVLSLPSGVFLPYSAVKTNVLFSLKVKNVFVKAMEFITTNLYHLINLLKISL